ncbi:hypothetical protein GCM10018953_08010 [Streptosporangium nondiastaticum]
MTKASSPSTLPQAEDLGVRGEPADERGQAEEGQAAEEDALAADQIADAAEEEGEPGRAQGEGGGDPLQVGQGEAEGVADLGQGHVQDREVDGQHELGDQQHHEDGFHAAGQPLRDRGTGHRLCGHGHDGELLRTLKRLYGSVKM